MKRRKVKLGHVDGEKKKMRRIKWKQNFVNKGRQRGEWRAGYQREKGQIKVHHVEAQMP